jgi:hypothetical protein
MSHNPMIPPPPCYWDSFTFFFYTTSSISVDIIHSLWMTIIIYEIITLKAQFDIIHICCDYVSDLVVFWLPVEVARQRVLL